MNGSLLFLCLENSRFAVWKDQVSTIAEVQEIHRIPLFPKWIAGMCVVAGRAVTLADLSVCLSCPSALSGRTALIMREGEPIPGYLVRGTLQEIQSSAILPVPEPLKTTVIESCAAIDSVPIPIVDIAVLYRGLKESSWQAPGPAVGAQGAVAAASGSMAPAGMEAITNDGESFAVRAGKLWEKRIPPSPIVALPSIPEGISGILFHDGALLAAVDVSKYLDRPRGAAEKSLITAEIGGTLYAFPDDEPGGAPYLSGQSRDCPPARVVPLPPVLHMPWMQDAAIQGREVLPILDLEAMVGSRPDSQGEPPLPERYSPESAFHALLGEQAVNVVEFSLLGGRVAVPRTEAASEMPCLPVRRVPRAPRIVIGVSQLEGRLLPVVDLAALFGRLSRPTPGWRMIRVRNGDFEALVIAESVFGDKRLDRSLQRKVPLTIPHGVFYGCYIDGNAVRLILNVEALTVHFEKSLVKELEPAFSSRMWPDLEPGFSSASDSEETPMEPAVMEEQAASALETEPAAPAPAMEQETIAPEAEQAAPAPVEEPSMPAPTLEQAAPAPIAEQETSTPTVGQAAPPPQAPPVSTMEQPVPAAEAVEPAHVESRKRGTRRRRIIAAASSIAAVLVAAICLFFALGHVRRGAIGGAQIAAEKPDSAKETAAAESAAPPLELEVPQESLDMVVYTVVEGDTLWAISERFTGNPHNYPRVAGENKIPDPDLIFPGQKILLRKK